MSMNVLIVGGRYLDEEEFTDVFDGVSETHTRFKERCLSPSELIGKVQCVVAKSTPAREKLKIDLLDFFCHTDDSGSFCMGAEVLFSPDGKSQGYDIARRLYELKLFTTDARVRLLGCESVVGEAGRDVVINTWKAFGKSIVVYGAIDVVDANDFDQSNHTGFRQTADHRLRSSTDLKTKKSWKLAVASVLEATRAHDRTHRTPIAKSK
jgi:hypothetical protein